MDFPKIKKYFQAIIFILLFFILSFSLSACFRQIKPISKKDNNKKIEQKQEQTASPSKATEQKNQADYILKKVDTDENGWNIYRSEKYGFEFKAPDKYVKYDTGRDKRYGVFVSFKDKNSINNFVVHIKDIQKPIIISNKGDFIVWKCGSATTSVLECNKIIQNYLQSDAYMIVSTIEYVGLDEQAVFYYIFNISKPNDNLYFFTTNIPKDEYLKIVKTFKIIK